MKVCFIVGAFPPMKCGIGDYTYNLCRELLKNDIEIDVITSKKVDSSRIGKIRVHNVIDKWDYSDLANIIREIKQIQPDIVHIQYPSDEYGKSFFINFLPSILKKKFKVKVIETVHEYLNYTTKGKLRNLINYKAADTILVVENQYINKIKSFAPLFSKRLNIKYIPIGSNIPKSNINSNQFNGLKEKLGLKGEKIISYFGFVNQLKGIETLLDSFNIILKTNKNVKLLLIAELDKNNEYHEKISKRISDLKLEKNIVITGYVDSADEVADYLKVSDLVVLPFTNGVSERNGSFLAAYNQDVPIITTSIEHKDDFNGVFYVKPGDTNAVVDKINYILNDETKYLRKVLSWNEISKMQKDIYYIKRSMK